MVRISRTCSDAPPTMSTRFCEGRSPVSCRWSSPRDRSGGELDHGEGSRPDDSAKRARPRRRGDRVICCKCCASLLARHRVACVRRECPQGGAYENSIAPNDHHLEPFVDNGGGTNGVRAGASYGTA